jgi:RNA polymerase sigma factor (sigma-70 family)
MHDFSTVVLKISGRDNEAVVALYGLLDGFRKRLIRQLGAFDGEEGFHSGFVALLDLIYGNRLANPKTLIAVANTIFHRQYCQTVRQRVKDRDRHVALTVAMPDLERSSHPLDNLLHEQKVRLMREALSELPGKWKELMVRFYVNDESKEEICATMRISENQFRLHKSRAKARLIAAISKRTAVPKAPLHPCVSVN